MTHSRHGVHKSMKMLLEATIPLRFHVNDAAERPLLEFIRIKKVDNVRQSYLSHQITPK